MTETQGLHIAVVGATGAVGQQMIQTLEKRDFPIKKLSFYLRLVQQEQSLSFKGEEVRSSRSKT